MLYALIDSSEKQRFNQISSEEILGEVRIMTPKIKEKPRNKLVKKIIKEINVHKVENVLLSNELVNNKILQHALEESKKYVITGRRMSKVLLNRFISEIATYTKVPKEKLNILLLMNEYSLENIDLIEYLSKGVKEFNVVSRNYTKYEKTANKLFEQYGYMINLYNIDSSKDFRRVNLVINLDFTENEFKKIKLPKNSIIISLNNLIKNQKSGFNGIIINDIEIKLRKKEDNLKYRGLALCEAQIYKPFRNLKDNERIFNLEKYIINGYIGNEGKITVEEFEKIGRNFT